MMGRACGGGRRVHRGEVWNWGWVDLDMQLCHDLPCSSWFFCGNPPAKGVAEAPIYSAGVVPFPSLASLLSCHFHFASGTASLYLCSLFIFISHTPVSASY